MTRSNKVLNWGLIGCGDIARKRVASALKDLNECSLVAVSRARFDKAEDFATQFGVDRVYRDWTELLKDPDIEAVYIATPVDLHAPMTIMAAESGKHVLCEKPMALNPLQCDEMILTCRQNGVKLGIAYYRRFYPVVRRIKEIIAAGEIGPVIFVQVNAFEYFNPPPDDPRSWFVKKLRAGGGPMFDFGCHRIELLLNLFGGVKQAGGSTRQIAFKREVEDTATAILDFQDGPQAVLTVTHAAFEPKDSLNLFGSKGSIHVPLLNQGNLRVRTSKGDRIENYPPCPNFHLPLIQDFASAVFEDRNPEVDGVMGREVNRVLDRIYRSSGFGYG